MVPCQCVHALALNRDPLALVRQHPNLGAPAELYRGPHALGCQRLALDTLAELRPCVCGGYGAWRTRANAELGLSLFAGLAVPPSWKVAVAAWAGAGTDRVRRSCCHGHRGACWCSATGHLWDRESQRVAVEHAEEGAQTHCLTLKKKKRFIGGLMLWQSGLSLHLQQSPSCSTSHALPAASH